MQHMLTLKNFNFNDLAWFGSPDIGLMVRVFVNSPGDLGSILGRVIPKTQKVILDATLLNTQHYKVRVKVNGAIQGKEKRPPQCLDVVAIKKGAFGSSSTTVANFSYLHCLNIKMVLFFKIPFSISGLFTSI